MQKVIFALWIAHTLQPDARASVTETQWLPWWIITKIMKLFVCNLVYLDNKYCYKTIHIS